MRSHKALIMIKEWGLTFSLLRIISRKARWQWILIISTAHLTPVFQSVTYSQRESLFQDFTHGSSGARIGSSVTLLCTGV